MIRYKEHPVMQPQKGSDWADQLKGLIRSEEELWRFLKAPVPQKPGPLLTMSVTPYYASLIDPQDPNDPILRQILPQKEELIKTEDTSLDPLAEQAHSPVKGLVHRYPDRALLLTTGFCPVYCRFCLRKRAWTQDYSFDLKEVLAYLKTHTEIQDVILSGGDPLFIPSSGLEAILDGVSALSHIKIIRISSRAPATLPDRIDKPLVELLKKYRPLWFLTHFNHPAEMTPQARDAVMRLARAGINVNNQSVLLKGVNNRLEILMELSNHLLECGVRPYYLHQVDYVEGISHFRVPIDEGIELVRGLFGRISGLGIPRYVIDLPGGKGKAPLMPNYLEKTLENRLIFQAPLGGQVTVNKTDRKD